MLDRAEEGSCWDWAPQVSRRRGQVLKDLSWEEVIKGKKEEHV